MVSVEIPPERCENCWRPFSTGLVGWSNLHDPPCRTYTCGECGHVMHVLHPRRVNRP